jgi:hypothetical protein
MGEGGPGVQSRDKGGIEVAFSSISIAARCLTLWLTKLEKVSLARLNLLAANQRQDGRASQPQSNPAISRRKPSESKGLPG